MTILMGILFFLLIMVSIALHELGHLIPAKLFGVKVTQYMVGFGKTLWSTTKGGTEYGIKAIPFGGYVRLIGMYPPGKPGRFKWLNNLADEARSAEAEHRSAADDGSLLYQKKSWQKIIVMMCGPAMNLFLAFVIFLSINVFHGQYQLQLTVAGVNDCVIPAGRAERTCQPSDPPTPAKKAGFQPGDVIVEFNGVRLGDWRELAEQIKNNGAGKATIVVIRDGAELTLPTVNTVINEIPDDTDPTKTISAGFLGVRPAVALEKGGVGKTISDIWKLIKNSAYAISVFPIRVWHVGVDLITGTPRDANDPISIVGASVAAGELATADALPIGSRIASWLSILGSVNLFLAVLNIVPLVPLDGGHVAGAIYEWLRRRLAKLFGKPDPGYADTAKMLPVAYLVGGFLLLAGVLLVIADIVSPVSIL